MFQERIKEITNILNTTNNTLAEYAGCSPSCISRLKSGARTPQSDSPTIRTVVNGIIKYATTNNVTDKICSLIGKSDKRVDALDIINWLYDGETSDNAGNSQDSPKSPPDPTFSEKLNMVMLLTGLSNIRLAHLINVDPSHISRFRNGKRSPKSNPEMFDKLCTALFEQTESKNMLDKLITLINSSTESVSKKNGELDRDKLFLHFHAWLNDFDSADHDSIRHLLGTLDTFSPNLNITIPPLEQIVSNDIISEKQTAYIGISGLQTAVLRFLGNAAKHHYNELLLYSDQSMEWMVNDPTFRTKWAFLMATCIKQGTRIKIIHNINRDITEMMQAVESWMPLYISGMVESYYSKKPSGSRFSHTIFLCPGKACISACHSVGLDEKSLYNYYTDGVNLDFMKNNFNNLLKNSTPLVFIKHEANGENNKNIVSTNQFNNLSITIGLSTVIIVKESAPHITLTFAHPLMCRAFQAYIDNHSMPK